MRSSSVEAVVLKVTDYREADVIVTLFSREQGKLRGIAPNARKSRKRFGGALDLFARLTLSVRLREGLSRLEEAGIVNIFAHIRKDITKVAHAGYACELTDILLPDGLPNLRYYRLLCTWLERLDSSPPSPADRLFFEINLLNILGYRPELEQCPVCNRPFDGARPINFHPSAHALTCRSCAGAGITITPTVPRLLCSCLSTGRFGTVRFSPEELADAGTILSKLIISSTGKELKSLRFLREVEPESFSPPVSDHA
jgi:DNA repair protein RecO (recombination protein O)